jgi:hypothetical protein
MIQRRPRSKAWKDPPLTRVRNFAPCSNAMRAHARARWTVERSSHAAFRRPHLVIRRGSLEGKSKEGAH